MHNWRSDTNSLQIVVNGISKWSCELNKLVCVGFMAGHYTHIPCHETITLMQGMTVSEIVLYLLITRDPNKNLVHNYSEDQVCKIIFFQVNNLCKYKPLIMPALNKPIKSIWKILYWLDFSISSSLGGFSITIFQAQKPTALRIFNRNLDVYKSCLDMYINTCTYLLNDYYITYFY